MSRQTNKKAALGSLFYGACIPVKTWSQSSSPISTDT